MEENPKSEYLRILYKINEIYTRNLPKVNYDLLNEIEYYSSKKLNQNDLITLHNFCLNEWNKVLKKLGELLVTKIESKKKFKETLRVEQKEIKKVIIRLEKNCIELSDYEKIYDEDLDKLKDKIEVNLSIEKFEMKKFWPGIIWGFILGIIGGIIVSKLI